MGLREPVLETELNLGQEVRMIAVNFCVLPSSQ